MAGRAAAPEVGHSRCTVCRAPIIRTRWLGLPITATLRPLTPAEQTAVWDGDDRNRLVWCLRENRWTPTRLIEIHRHTHPASCPHPHIACHRCPVQTAVI
jgi:hypothetical protein